MTRETENTQNTNVWRGLNIVLILFNIFSLTISLKTITLGMYVSTEQLSIVVKTPDASSQKLDNQKRQLTLN